MIAIPDRTTPAIACPLFGFFPTNAIMPSTSPMIAGTIPITTNVRTNPTIPSTIDAVHIPLESFFGCCGLPCGTVIGNGAPQFWQKLGLEWLYRLLQEPHLMWQRYLKYAPTFYRIKKKTLKEYKAQSKIRRETESAE